MLKLSRMKITDNGDNLWNNDKKKIRRKNSH